MFDETAAQTTQPVVDAALGVMQARQAAGDSHPVSRAIDILDGEADELGKLADEVGDGALGVHEFRVAALTLVLQGKREDVVQAITSTLESVADAKRAIASIEARLRSYL